MWSYKILTLWERLTEAALHVFYRMSSSIAYTGCSKVCFKADATGHQKLAVGENGSLWPEHPSPLYIWFTGGFEKLSLSLGI